MQKTALAFLLSASAFLLSASSCWMNPNMQGHGQDYLQGEWQQDSVPMQKQLLTYSLYHFRFSCDSFFISINTFSKVNYGADTCMAKGHWVEYTRGVYGQRNDTLFLKGQFCNPDYTIKEKTDCFRIGNYEELFKIVKRSDSTLLLSGTINTLPVSAKLIKRAACHVKPL